jgi:hypothetical protein
MGNLIAEHYVRAERIGGHLAKFRLAVLTKMTSSQALTEPDTPELTERFNQALALIEREFAEGRAKRAPSLHTVAPSDSPEQASVLRRHIRAFLEMMSQRTLFLQDLDVAMSRITETAASTLDVARASIWFLNPQKTQMHCVDLFEVSDAKHSKGIILNATDFPTYFDALASERTIAAHDARVDLRTSEFTEVYLKPLNIFAMLDVPIWVRGKMVGVVCHEQTDKTRTWSSDEESFAYLVANFAALMIERDPSLFSR